MRPVIGTMFAVLLAFQDVWSDELALTSHADRVPAGTIEFYDDEVDFGDELPQDAQQAEHLKLIMAMTPRVHNIIRSRAVSPNGQRVVYIVERDSGATTIASLHAFIGLPASPSEDRTFHAKMLGDQIFMGDKMTTRASCEWKDDHHLIIYSDGEASFLSAEHDGVSILHEFQ